MICFQLKCYNGHVFDSWFRDSQSYDQQQQMNLVVCPTCGICDVSKAITAPNIIKDRADQKQEKKSEPLIDADLQMKELVRNVDRYVATNFENVGDKFAAEARKIHEGEIKGHGIYGKASPQDAQDLIDDGIDIFVMPSISAVDA